MAMTGNKSGFANSTIKLDGSHFVDCTFDNVTLIYEGGSLPNFERCSFTDVKIAFGGGAANTLMLLHTFFHTDFRPLIEQTLESITSENSFPEVTL